MSKPKTITYEQAEQIVRLLDEVLKMNNSTTPPEESTLDRIKDEQEKYRKRYLEQRDILTRINELERINFQFPLAVSGQAFDKYVRDRLKNLSKQAVKVKAVTK